MKQIFDSKCTLKMDTTNVINLEFIFPAQVSKNKNDLFALLLANQNGKFM